MMVGSAVANVDRVGTESERRTLWSAGRTGRPGVGSIWFGADVGTQDAVMVEVRT